MSALLGAVGIRRTAPRARPGAMQRLGRGVGRVAGGFTPGATTRGMRRHKRRRRGISGAELRGFKKVARFLADFGMRPRGLAHPMHRRSRGFSRRHRGDPDFGSD